MGNKYKVILQSGRELGPLTEEEVKKFIKKNIIIGNERARVYPNGEWKPIQKISELRELILEILESELHIKKDKKKSGPIHIPQEPVLGTTVILDSKNDELFNENKSVQSDDKKNEEEGFTKTEIVKADGKEEHFQRIKNDIKKSFFNEEDETEIFSEALLNINFKEAKKNLSVLRDDDKTVLFTPQEIIKNAPIKNNALTSKVQGAGSLLRLALLGALFYLVFDSVFDDKSNNKNPVNQGSVTARIPKITDAKPKPDVSERFYLSAMEDYLKDSTRNYIIASKKLHLAIISDKDNVRAISMLASTYLNLIDVANKKDNYFTVIRDLIEMARAKNLDLLETVIADIEFYSTVDQLKTAERRIVDYTRGKENYPIELFYYLSSVYFLDGNYEEAKRFLSRYEGESHFLLGPRVLYLKGQVAEKLGEIQEAENFYKDNLKKFPEHTKSILALVEVLRRQGKEIEAKPIVDILILNKEYLSVKELARSLFLSGVINKSLGDIKRAITSIRVAVQIEPDNRAYILELFNLRVLLGEIDPKLKSRAKIYYHLSEGEKLLQKGEYDEAIKVFLLASFEDGKSPLPHIQLGDIFYRKRKLRNAKDSYEKAVFLDPTNINVWSKYIQVLLDSYEWLEVEKAIKKLSLIPSQKSASLVRRIRGEVFARQGHHRQAIESYIRAMAYEDIDTEVYIAYAQSLLALHEVDQARFFFSLGRRFDPYNREAIFGIAKAIAKDKSLDEAIAFLEYELKKQSGKNAEILSKIAELKLQKGDVYGARQSINRAKAMDPDAASPYGVEGQIELMNKSDSKALVRALNAFKFYSDRNSSDPSGYIKRFEIFMQKGSYAEAKTELERVYRDYPRYPGLHYLYGELYSALGNKNEAISEYRQEIHNHPGSSESMLKLGILLIEAGEPKEALNYFIQADKYKGSQWAEAKSWAGYANFIMKNYEGAVSLYLSAIQIDGGNPIHYKRIGFAQLAQGDKANARQSFATYLQLAPDAPDRTEILKQMQ